MHSKENNPLKNHDVNHTRAETNMFEYFECFVATEYSKQFEYCIAGFLIDKVCELTVIRENIYSITYGHRIGNHYVLSMSPLWFHFVYL